MRTTNSRTKKLLAGFVASLIATSAAHAGGSLTSTISPVPTRRLEIVIQDPPAAAAAPAVSADAAEPSPIGQTIVGTMFSSGRRYAVTPTELFQEGDIVGGHRVTQITLDRVTFTSGRRVHSYDLLSGHWTAGESTEHAE